MWYQKCPHHCHVPFRALGGSALYGRPMIDAELAVPAKEAALAATERLAFERGQAEPAPPPAAHSPPPLAVPVVSSLLDGDLLARSVWMCGCQDGFSSCDGTVWMCLPYLRS